jgi:hypothetical protein
MANSGSFAVSIKLIDLATGPLRQVNTAITGLEKTVKHAAREGGLLEVRDALTRSAVRPVMWAAALAPFSHLWAV